MRLCTFLFLIINLNVSAQYDLAGYYTLEGMSYTCNLDLKADSTYTFNCRYHMQPQLYSKGNWQITDQSTILLKNDTTENLYIKNNTQLYQYSEEKPKEKNLMIYFHYNYYNKSKSYHKNGRIHFNGSYWNKRKSFFEEPKRQGYWKYYRNDGTLLKLEKYKKGKLKNTISDTYKMYQILNRQNRRTLNTAQ